MKPKNRPSEVVFDRVINRAMFADTVRLSIRGSVREQGDFAKSIRVDEKVPIHNGKNHYGLMIRATFVPTGNPIQVFLHRMSRFPNVPDSRLNLFYEPGFEVSPSYFELAADIEEWEVKELVKYVFGRARRRAELEDDEGRKTLYMGSPKASTQVCIYQKKRMVVRIEFRFHHTFFRENHIGSLSEIGRLRTIDLSHVFELREFRTAGLKQAIRSLKCTTEWDWRMFREWHRHNWPLELLEAGLRIRGVDTDDLLRPLALQHLLNAMQRQMVW
jgi:hypothetical protein